MVWLAFDPGCARRGDRNCAGVFKTLVCLEVECIVLSLMGSTCSSSPISCYTLLPSVPRVVSHMLFFFFTVTHAHSFSLVFPFFRCKLSLWRRSRRHILPAIWQCQGRPEQMCSALGPCSVKHMHVHAHAHTHTGSQSGEEGTMTDNSVI